MANEIVGTGGNPLGLPLDMTDVLKARPCVVTWGAPGGGKTFEVVRAFSRQPGKVLFVQSSPTGLKSIADYIAKNPGCGVVLPDKVTLDEETVAKYFGGSTMGALLTIASRFIAKAQSGQPDGYDTIIFDEHNVFCDRVYTELKASPHPRFKGKNGNQNIFAVMDAFKEWHRFMLSLPRRTRKTVVFVAHYQLPKVDEEPSSPTYGSIKWPGGPKMPMGLSDQIVELCAEADAVLQLVVEEPAKAAPISLDGTPPATPAADIGSARRKILTTLEPKWFRKVRGYDVPAEEPLDIGKGRGLRELLLRCGFDV